MSLNVNVNLSAQAALQSLNRIDDDLNATQARVSSGLKVASAKDGAAVFAVAQQQRADVSALGAVTDGLNRAQSISDVALAAGQQVSDYLSTLKTKVLAATSTTLDASSRSALAGDVSSLLAQIQQTVSSASFGGVNLLNGASSAGVQFLANADGSGTLTLSAQNFSLGGPLIGFPANAGVDTATQASSVLTQVTSAIDAVDGALARIGSQSNQISAHASFVAQLSTALTNGVGNLVDSDEAAESARLTALQVQQQLGVQTLSIANQQPSIILSLLKGG